jgi:hypothetical protein
MPPARCSLCTHACTIHRGIGSTQGEHHLWPAPARRRMDPRSSCAELRTGADRSAAEPLPLSASYMWDTHSLFSRSTWLSFTSARLKSVSWGDFGGTFGGTLRSTIHWKRGDMGTCGDFWSTSRMCARAPFDPRLVEPECSQSPHKSPHATFFGRFPWLALHLAWGDFLLVSPRTSAVWDYERGSSNAGTERT